MNFDNLAPSSKWTQSWIFCGEKNTVHWTELILLADLVNTFINLSKQGFLRSDQFAFDFDSAKSSLGFTNRQVHEAINFLRRRELITFEPNSVEKYSGRTARTISIKLNVEKIVELNSAAGGEQR